MSEGVPAAGDVIAGKFRVERVIGKGGMGVVVAAQNLQLGERVALKMMLPRVAQDPVAVARFLREARSMARIRSEHVVRVLDVVTTELGMPVLVMEFLEGNDLFAHVMRRGPVDSRTAADYLLQAILAIAEAHALGIVHRDIKPQNLFLTTRRDGTPCIKVLDFGIAQSEDGGSRGLTGTGILVGSPQYMSPEQLFAQTRVDVRADVWALGCVLYEILTGAVPFEAASLPDLLIKVQQAPPTPLSSRVATVPVGVDAIVAKALEKDPARRFADVGLMAAALAPFGSEGSDALAARAARTLQAEAHVVHAGAKLADAGAQTMFAAEPALSTGVPISVSRSALGLPPKSRIPATVLLALAAIVAMASAAALWLSSRGGLRGTELPEAGIAASRASAPPPPSVDLSALLPLDADAGPSVPSANVATTVTPPPIAPAPPRPPSSAQATPTAPPSSGGPADFRRR